MSLHDYDNEQMRIASPSALDAQNEDVKTALKVLKTEAEQLNPGCEKELLEAARKFLKTEVL